MKWPEKKNQMSVIKSMYMSEQQIKWQLLPVGFGMVQSSNDTKQRIEKNTCFQITVV